MIIYLHFLYWSLTYFWIIIFSIYLLLKLRCRSSTIWQALKLLVYISLLLWIYPWSRHYILIHFLDACLLHEGKQSTAHLESSLSNWWFCSIIFPKIKKADPHFICCIICQSIYPALHSSEGTTNSKNSNLDFSFAATSFLFEQSAWMNAIYQQLPISDWKSHTLKYIEENLQI